MTHLPEFRSTIVARAHRRRKIFGRICQQTFPAILSIDPFHPDAGGKHHLADRHSFQNFGPHAAARQQGHHHDGMLIDEIGSVGYFSMKGDPFDVQIAQPSRRSAAGNVEGKVRKLRRQQRLPNLVEKPFQSVLIGHPVERTDK